MPEETVNLKKLRKLAAMTQFELAQRCGVSRMRLSLAECEQIDLNAEELAAICKTLFEAIENRAIQIRYALTSADNGPVSVTA
jgi:transcriptional regulator with XRE-family HTH domain